MVVDEVSRPTTSSRVCYHSSSSIPTPIRDSILTSTTPFQAAPRPPTTIIMADKYAMVAEITMAASTLYEDFHTKRYRLGAEVAGAAVNCVRQSRCFYIAGRRKISRESEFISLSRPRWKIMAVLSRWTMCCEGLKRSCSCSTGQRRPLSAFGPQALGNAGLAIAQVAQRSTSGRLSSHHVDCTFELSGDLTLDHLASLRLTLVSPCSQLPITHQPTHGGEMVAVLVGPKVPMLPSAYQSCWCYCQRLSTQSQLLLRWGKKFPRCGRSCGPS
jgi:hypothetical protein